MNESHQYESDTLTIPKIRATVVGTGGNATCEPDCFFCTCPETD